MFINAFKTTTAELAQFLVEDGFLDEVMGNLDHWKMGSSDVIAAIKRRAEDTSDKDQLLYAAVYLAIAKHPAAGAVKQFT